MKSSKNLLDSIEVNGESNNLVAYTTTMVDVYEKYKPLRNFLNKADLINCLGAIRWYINFLQLKTPQAQFTDLEVPSEFINGGVKFIQPWQLTVLARELIICSGGYSSDYDFRQWKYMARALQRLKDIDDYIGENYINPENILHFISKALPHQQFAWQENRPNYATVKSPKSWTLCLGPLLT